MGIETDGIAGKVCLVTGSSRGIGREIARSYAARGARLVLNYLSDATEAAAAAAELRGKGAEVLVVQADVGDWAQVDGLYSQIEASLGGVDILINNAGITRDRTALKMDPADWDQVLRVNLSGAFYCAKRALPGMVARRFGRIISISSVIGRFGSFGQTNYAAAKAGLIGMTKALAKEVAAKGILVNAIAPGFIETRMTDAIAPELRDKIASGISLKRFGTPEEVAALAVFLPSDGARYVTGHTFGVDGGYPA